MPATEALVFIPSDIASARDGAFRPDRRVERFSGQTMGTYWKAAVAGPGAIDRAAVEAALQQAFQLVVEQMSPWEPTSDLRRFGAAQTGEWVPFRPESFFVLARALQIAAQCDGRYDPTFAEAIDLLGFGPSACPGFHYGSTEVVAALAAANFRALQLDSATRSVRQPGRLGLDLCSIAKGYAIDLAAQALEAVGYRNFLIEIGGEARGLGCKPDGSPWLYAIERPPKLADKRPPLHAVLCGNALASSGNFVRFRPNPSGEPIGHIVQPRFRDDKEPLLAVSALCDNCMDADAYATALFLLGPSDGLRLATELGIAAVFQTVKRDLLSPAANAMLA